MTLVLLDVGKVSSGALGKGFPADQKRLPGRVDTAVPSGMG